MKKNIGTIDQIVRIAIALTLIYLSSVVYKDTPWGIGLAIISLIPLITALLGNCPIYNLLGISTCKAKSNLRSK